MASDPDTIARSFVEYYYTAFDSGKEGIKSLASLYVRIITFPFITSQPLVSCHAEIAPD